MSRLLNSKKIFDFLTCLGLICSMAALVIFPKESIQAAKEGLTLCTNVILPSLFPFFVLSALMLELGIGSYFGRLLEPVMRPLFNVNGTCAIAFILGFIGGYPVGATTAISLYEQGHCTKDEAERLLSFCNNSGPAFILGVVGAGIFSSSRIGLLLYFAHAIASVCVGILFRSWGNPAKEKKKNTPLHIKTTRLSLAFVKSVKNSFQSTLNICGFVIFFTVIIKLLFLSGIIPGLAKILGDALSGFGFDHNWAERLLTGIFEISSGVWSLKEASEIRKAIAMAAFMLGWAGISVHCQVLTFISDSDLSVKSYIGGKFLHGGISAVLVFLFARLFTFDAPVASYLVEQVSGIANIDFGAAIKISTLTAIVLWLVFLGISLFSAKRAGNEYKDRL